MGLSGGVMPFEVPFAGTDGEGERSGRTTSSLLTRFVASSNAADDDGGSGEDLSAAAENGERAPLRADSAGEWRLEIGERDLGNDFIDDLTKTFKNLLYPSPVSGLRFIVLHSRRAASRRVLATPVL